MKSPKFYLREKELRTVIDAKRLESTWRNKLRDQLRKQFLPDPVDFLDFHSSVSHVAKGIETTVFNGTYSAATPDRFLVEKSKGLCRQLVIPSVRDAMVLQCLSDALWADLKGKAPTKNSFFEPSDNRFFAGNEREGYGPFKSWLRFQKKNLFLLERKKLRNHYRYRKLL